MRCLYQRTVTLAQAGRTGADRMRPPTSRSGELERLASARSCRRAARDSLAQLQVSILTARPSCKTMKTRVPAATLIRPNRRRTNLRSPERRPRSFPENGSNNHSSTRSMVHGKRVRRSEWRIPTSVASPTAKKNPAKAQPGSRGDLSVALSDLHDIHFFLRYGVVGLLDVFVRLLLNFFLRQATLIFRDLSIILGVSN